MNQTPPFLTAEWRHLVMLNYQVNPDILLPYLPQGTELDTWNGRTYISIVGFLFLDTRILGVPIPFHINFEEINLRFYVRRLGPEGWRRGVVFIKEIVPRFAIAAVARLVYNENYVAHPMRHALHPLPGGGLQVSYGWRSHGGWHTITAETQGNPLPLDPDSEAAFIAEHYWGYAVQRDGRTVEYQVEHPPWRVWPAAHALFYADTTSLYGRAFTPYLDAAPTSTFIAEGSAVTVRRGAILP